MRRSVANVWRLAISERGDEPIRGHRVPYRPIACRVKPGRFLVGQEDLFFSSSTDKWFVSFHYLVFKPRFFFS